MIVLRCMRNFLFVFFLSLSKITFSQEHEVFYQTANGAYAFKLENGNCMLYDLSPYDDQVYREWELYPVYSAKDRSDSLGMLFSNGQYAISYDYKYFRVCQLKHGKVKDRMTYTAKKLSDPSKVYQAINHSYWDTVYRRAIDETAGKFPLFSEYRYLSYLIRDEVLWSSFSFKQKNPQEFKVLAEEHGQLLKDSLLQTNRRLVSLNDSIAKNIHTLTLEELKSNFLRRPIHVPAYNEYQDAMLENVARKRPDLFFGLAEVLPDEKEYLFDCISLFDGVKSLKKFETDAPVKKEFLKYRRREQLKAGLLITGAGLLEIGVIGGAITGIVYWVRK